MSLTSKEHKAKLAKKLNFAVFICSTSRYQQMVSGEKQVSDVSGDVLVTLLKNAGHNVMFKEIIADDKELIKKAVEYVLGLPDLDVAIFSGGTGITLKDVTIESVSPFFEKTLPGFGEFFRRISFDRIGASVVLSRAVAGVAKGKALFCIPGSPDAVKISLEMLILPEAPHIVKHARE
jgi:molybdopterin adenylyltransferase